jgi:enterochelin esterase-like enzyme
MPKPRKPLKSPEPSSRVSFPLFRREGEKPDNRFEELSSPADSTVGRREPPAVLKERGTLMFNRRERIGVRQFRFRRARRSGGSLRWSQLAVAILAVLSAALPVAAQPEPAVAYGHKDYVDSKSTGERREVLVFVPDVPQGVKVPLLVTLDAAGGERVSTFRVATTSAGFLSQQGRLPPMAVAGIVNTNRGRDMNPSFEGSEFASGDASARFLNFICDELVPYLEQKYPVSHYRALYSRSNAGLFTMYALARRPETLQAHIIGSPMAGDERIQPLLARTLARPGLGPHFLFLSMGDEETDIALGTTRLAKTIEESASPSFTYRYEYFPGETHASGGMKALYRALELLGEPDPVSPKGAARYLSENQRREQAWLRRFGAAYATRAGAAPYAIRAGSAPLVSAVRPLLDSLAESGREGLPASWASLKGEYGSYFGFAPLDLANLLAYLEANGRKEDAAALRSLPGFAADTEGRALNNYGASVDLSAGLAAHIVMDGSLRDLADPATQFQVQGAVPCADRRGREGRAWRFNGRDAFISVTGNSALRAGGSLTVSAWIRPRIQKAYAGWISQLRSSGGSRQWRVGFGTSPDSQWGATTVTTRWTDYWTSGAGIEAGKWVRVVAVFDQVLGTLKLYQDGKLVKDFFGVAPMAANGGPVLIGLQRDDGIFYDGDVGEIRIYDRSLNAQEVDALYRAE